MRIGKSSPEALTTPQQRISNGFDFSTEYQEVDSMQKTDPREHMGTVEKATADDKEHNDAKELDFSTNKADKIEAKQWYHSTGSKRRQHANNQRDPEQSIDSHDADRPRRTRPRTASAAADLPRKDAGTVAVHRSRVGQLMHAQPQGRHRGRAPPNGDSSTASAHGATRAPTHVPVPCRARIEFIEPHPAGAGKDRPRHPARPAGESAGGQGKRRKGRASPTAKVPSTQGRPGAQRGRHRTRGSSTGAPAEERPCKRRHSEAAPELVPDARLSGRGWHERWPPPAGASGGHAHLGGR